MIHPSTWMVVLGACKQVTITNLHQIGEVVSSDGIDVVGSQDIEITGCFLRNNDDCVVVKSLDLSRGQPPAKFDARRDAQDVLVQNCTFWNDRAGNAMEIGFELCTENIRRIVFRNIDVLAAHGEGAVFSIHNGDRASVSDVLWEDIRVEHFYDKLIDFRIMSSRYSQDQTRGHIRNIRFRNIQTIADIYNTPSLIGGYDSEHRIENVRFENFVMGGAKILDADAIHLFSKHADGIRFE
jgi:polygalacturonase